MNNKENMLLKQNGVVQVKAMRILDRVKTKTKRFPIQARIDYDMAMKFKKELQKRNMKINAVIAAAISSFLDECSQKRAKAN